MTMKKNPTYENFKAEALKVYNNAESVANISVADIVALSGTTDKTESFFGNMRQTLADEMRQQENEGLCSTIAVQLIERFPAIEVAMKSERIIEVYLNGRSDDEEEALDIGEVL
jgi:hypothetical protein